MVEISQEISKEEALEVMNFEDVKSCIQVCKNAFMRRETNTVRIFFKDLAMIAENSVDRTQ